MNKKILVVILALVVFVSGAIYLSLNKSSKPNLSQSPLPTIYPTIIPTLVPTETPALENGTISGKLCYPSSFIPKGNIEFKNTETEEITIKQYEGSDKEKSSGFTQKLKPGKYILRFDTAPEGQNKYYGYSTDVCSTGSETSCKGENLRKNNIFTVESNVDTEDINICDFYYTKDTEPKF